jgi:hypothetical protein
MVSSRKRKEFKSGIYRPKNISKFGEPKCLYRSNYELQFLKWCDAHPKITDVKYEKVIIPYICKTDGKMHKYYVDCKITMEESKGKKDYLIEIKPFRQTIPPKPSKRKKQTTILQENFNWLKNSSKWSSAKQYCKKQGYRWCILTEKGIYIDDKFYEGKLLGF